MKDHDCIQAENIGKLKSATEHVIASINRLDKRVNGTFDSIAKHIEQGSRWRMAIISVALALVLNVVAFSYMYGRLCKTVENNEDNIKEMIRYGQKDIRESHDVGDGEVSKQPPSTRS